MVWLLVQDYSTHVGVLTQLVIYNYFNNLCALALLREKFLFFLIEIFTNPPADFSGKSNQMASII